MAEPRKLPTETGEALSGWVGRFLLRERIGGGGMGEVYLAEDSKLHRPVALKRMAPHLRLDERFRQRLLREAERASRLSDPHVAAIYDVVEERGETFLVMEYVEGVDLRLRLLQPITTEEFLLVAVQCVEALCAAHERGIVHCDIKPENIMLSPSGRVKVLDFGVAKRLPCEDQGATLDSSASTPTALSGTPAYMPPEVLLQKPPDARSDIFSLGVVFYEALTGRHPFLADGFVATCDRILRELPPPISSTNPDVPQELERIVSRMLAKDPAHRYQHAADLREDLRALQRTPPQLRAAMVARPRPSVLWLVISAVIIGLLIFTAIGTYQNHRLRRWLGLSTVPQLKHLAVLPFNGSGGDASVQAFSEGLAEVITAKLTQLTDRYPLQVVAPSEVRSQGVHSVEQARQDLGVNLVLEGSMRRSGALVRVTYSLVDAQSRRQLRADTITAQASDPFAVEDRVVDGVVDMLNLELESKDRSALASKGTTQPAAYDFYLRGRGYLQDPHKAENVDSAITVLQHALERDPNYALAYAGLGEAYWRKYELDLGPDWVSKATDACNRAVALAREAAAGHACLGMVFNGTGKYEAAVEQFQTAVQLDGTNDDAYRGLGLAYERLGKMEQAEQVYTRAIRLRPGYAIGYNWLGKFYFTRGRFEEAAEQFRQALALSPDGFRSYSNLGGTYLAQGNYAEAIPLLTRSIEIRPTASALSNLGTAYFSLRRFAEAARTYENAVKLKERNSVSWGNLAEAYYWAPGERDKSAAAYRTAIFLAEEAAKVNPRDAMVQADLALYHAMLQQAAAARRYLQRALDEAPDDPETMFQAAQLEMRLGDSAKALKWLERARQKGTSASLIEAQPLFDPLRDHARFRKLLGGGATN